MVRNGSETAWRTRHISVKALWLHQMSRRGVKFTYQPTSEMAADSLTKGHRSRKTFVWLRTSMSLSRSMWFHLTSFALSREWYGFKCVWLSHATPNRSPMRLWIVWSMYIRIHVESKADTMFRWFESTVYEETSSAWHCGVNVLRPPCLRACSAWHCGVIAFRPETCSAWHCGVIAFRPETCSAWHCGVYCLYVHVFYGIQVYGWASTDCLMFSF